MSIPACGESRRPSSIRCARLGPYVSVDHQLVGPLGPRLDTGFGAESAKTGPFARGSFEG